MTGIQKRTSSRAPIVGVVLVVGLLAAITLLKQRTDAPDDVNAQPPPGVDAQAQPGSPSFEAGGNQTAPRTPQTAQQAVKDILGERDEGRAEQTRRNARYKSALVDTYRSENADPAWADATERRLQALATDPGIQAAGVKADDMAIDCKRTTCRTSASFSSSGQADDWSMLYMASGGAVLRNSVVSRTQNADGSVSVDIYSTAK